MESKLVLIVDDEPDLCEILQLDFEDSGYKAVTANHAHEALEIASREQIDLVVSDIRMPGGDGIFLLDALREQDLTNPPLVLVSGFADIAPEEAYSRGASRVLPKPLPTEQLLDYASFVLKPLPERWQIKSKVENYSPLHRQFSSLQEAKEKKLFNLGISGFFCQEAGDKDLPRDLAHFKIQFQDDGITLEGIAESYWQRASIHEDIPKGRGFSIIEATTETIAFWQEFIANCKHPAQIPLY